MKPIRGATMPGANLVNVAAEGFMDDPVIPPSTPEKVEPSFRFDAVEFREKYAFVVITVAWDEGLVDLGGGNIKLRLPVPPDAPNDLPKLREWALREATAALDMNRLRAARPPAP